MYYESVAVHDRPDTFRPLIELAHLMQTEADKRARSFGLTRAQWLVLKRSADAPGLSQRKLAELLEVEAITVTRLVDRLQADGLIERRADPRDRRIWRLHCTKAAEPVLALLERDAAAIYEIAARGIDPPALKLMFKTMQRVKDNIGAGSIKKLLPVNAA